MINSVTDRILLSLSIPKQTLDIDVGFCSQLSYNSWQALADNQPLGPIQRVRRSVYTNLQEMRRAAQGVATAQPTWEQVLKAGKTLYGTSVAAKTAAKGNTAAAWATKTPNYQQIKTNKPRFKQADSGAALEPAQQ